jgi:hypothetical protein
VKLPSDPARAHRTLGYLAVFHSAFVLAFLFVFFFFAGENWLLSCLWWLWVGLATLWFFWPIVLLLHRGRSFRRIVVPLLVSYVFYLVWSRPYSRMLNPDRFGLPFGVDISPHSMLQYGISYGLGWFEGKRDARVKRLVLEGYGFGFEAPRAPHFSEEAAKSCGIEFLPVAGCVVNERIVGHAYGRNDATMAELRRQFPLVVKAAEDEDARWLQSYHDGEKAGRADATNELREGRLAIEVSDRPKKEDDEFERMLRERYQIGFRRVDPDADPKMANKVCGHKRDIMRSPARKLNDASVK